MYRDASAAHAAYLKARAMLANAGALRAQIESLAPAPDTSARRRRNLNTEEEEDEADVEAVAPEPKPTLESVSRSLLDAAMAMQRADVAPTAAQVEDCAKARNEFHAVMAKFASLTAHQ